MTEKDAVKCRAFALPNWWYLPVEAELPPVQAEQLLLNIEAFRPGTPVLGTLTAVSKKV